MNAQKLLTPQGIEHVRKLVYAAASVNLLLALAIFFPTRGPEALMVLVAIMLLVSAAVMAVHLALIGRYHGPMSEIILIVLRVGTAMMIFFHPLDTNITFTTLMGIYFGLDGALVIGEAKKLRRLGYLTMPSLITGIVSVVMCALLWLFLKGYDYFVISTLLALTFAVRAGSLFYTAKHLDAYVARAPKFEEPAAEA